MKIRLALSWYMTWRNPFDISTFSVKEVSQLIEKQNNKRFKCCLQNTRIFCIYGLPLTVLRFYPDENYLLAEPLYLVLLQDQSIMAERKCLWPDQNISITGYELGWEHLKCLKPVSFFFFLTKIQWLQRLNN